MQFVNWDLLANPMNWIIVALMLLIGTAALHLLMGDHRGTIFLGTGVDGQTPMSMQ